MCQLIAYLERVRTWPKHTYTHGDGVAEYIVDVMLSHGWLRIGPPGPQRKHRWSVSARAMSSQRYLFGSHNIIIHTHTHLTLAWTATHVDAATEFQNDRNIRV
jgi:hypothetical protein